MKKLLSVLLLVVMVFSLSVAVVGAAPPNQDGGVDHTVQKDDWPRLYDRDKLGGNSVPVAAAM